MSDEEIFEEEDFVEDPEGVVEDESGNEGDGEGDNEGGEEDNGTGDGTPDPEQPDQKYQKLQDEIRQLKQQKEFFRQLATQSKEEETDPEDDDEDDYVSTGRAKDIVKRELSRKEKAQQAEAIRAMEINEMEAEAKEQYSDYEEVVTKYTKDLVDKGQVSLDEIYNAKNPALKAYRLGRSHPDYVDGLVNKKIEERMKGITKKVNENSNKTKTLSNAPGSGKRNMDEASRIENMDREEFFKSFPALAK